MFSAGSRTTATCWTPGGSGTNGPNLTSTGANSTPARNLSLRQELGTFSLHCCRDKRSVFVDMTRALKMSCFPPPPPPVQVFVSCNFCGKSISFSCSAMPHQGRGFSQYGVSGSPTKSKVTSCPGCRKPLPRCALCLMNMGTPVSSCIGIQPGYKNSSHSTLFILLCIDE